MQGEVGSGSELTRTQNHCCQGRETQNAPDPGDAYFSVGQSLQNSFKEMEPGPQPGGIWGMESQAMQEGKAGQQGLQVPSPEEQMKASYANQAFPRYSCRQKDYRTLF